MLLYGQSVCALLRAAKELPSAIHAAAVWPQILVLVFASRVFAEKARLSFADTWQHPLGSAGAGPQSLSAGLALGAGLTLLFYHFLPAANVSATASSSAIILKALGGASLIHVAIVFLFLVIVACLIDELLSVCREDLAFRRLVKLMHERKIAQLDELATLVATSFRDLAHLRPICAVLDAARRGVGAAGSITTLESFHAASRRMMRALIPLLPLLGFLGTVVGLATALGELPQSFGSEGAGELDLARSLAGLSIKFETTLLGPACQHDSNDRAGAPRAA